MFDITEYLHEANPDDWKDDDETLFEVCAIIYREYYRLYRQNGFGELAARANFLSGVMREAFEELEWHNDQISGQKGNVEHHRTAAEEHYQTWMKAGLQYDLVKSVMENVALYLDDREGDTSEDHVSQVIKQVASEGVAERLVRDQKIIREISERWKEGKGEKQDSLFSELGEKHNISPSRVKNIWQRARKGQKNGTKEP